jgi:hypothetical protein
LLQPLNPNSTTAADPNNKPIHRLKCAGMILTPSMANLSNNGALQIQDIVYVRSGVNRTLPQDFPQRAN